MGLPFRLPGSNVSKNKFQLPQEEQSRQINIAKEICSVDVHYQDLSANDKNHF